MNYIQKIQNRAVGLVSISGILILMSGIALVMLSNSNSRLKLSQQRILAEQSEEILEAALQVSKQRLMEDTSSTFSNLSLEDIVDLVEADQAEDFLKDGLPGFQEAFGENWAKVDALADYNVLSRYRFKALSARVSESPLNIVMDFQYNIQVKSVNSKNSAFNTDQSSFLAAEDMGVFSVQVEAAPFSQWAIIRDSHLMSGSSSVEVNLMNEEHFFGPVHFNTHPAFWGGPVFHDWLTWSTNSRFSLPSEPTYAYDSSGNRMTKKIEPIEFPDNFFNLAKLALNELDQRHILTNQEGASSDISSEDISEPVLPPPGWQHSSDLSEPEAKGVYVASKDDRSIGGIYINGDVSWLRMRALNESEVFSSTQTLHDQLYGENSIPLECKVQEHFIEMADGETREIFNQRDIEDNHSKLRYHILVTEPSCPTAKTAISRLDRENSEQIEVLDGRLNGLVYIKGNVHNFGQIKMNSGIQAPVEDHPTLVKDYQSTLVVDRGTAFIASPITYEDAKLHDAFSGEFRSDTRGQGPGHPTDPNQFTVMPSGSKTVMGILTLKGNVFLRNQSNYSMQNPHLHTSIFAVGQPWNSDSGEEAYCMVEGRAKHCGFGVEDYREYSGGRGMIRLFGSLSETRTHAVGYVAGGYGGYTTYGYKKFYKYDTRLAEDVRPVFFPVTNIPLVTSHLLPARQGRLLTQKEISKLD